MAGIMVYLPGSTGVDVGDELRRVGLESLLDRSVSGILTPIESGGPDGGHGKLCTFDGLGLPDTPREFSAKTQTWSPAPPDGELTKDRYWLGYVNSAKPTPDELRRADVFDGFPVTLRDGHAWTIPIAEFLPKRLTRDRATGEEMQVPAAEHCEFANWSNAILDLLLSESFLEMVKREKIVQIPRGLTYAAMALAKNYRINVDVLDLLDLVSNHEAFDIARVACGFLALEKAIAQKKNMASPFRPIGLNSAPACSAAG